MHCETKIIACYNRNMKNTFLRNFFLITVLCLGFSPNNVLADYGCCEKLVVGNQACSDASCVTSCFSVPDKGSCDTFGQNNPENQKTQWNSGKCWGLPTCVGHTASGCCVVKNGNKTTCFATASEASCTVQAGGTGGNGTFSAKGCNAAENDAACKGNLEDANLYSTMAAETGSETTANTPKMDAPKPVTPKLQIKIPGLTLGPVSGSFETGYSIPFIAQYIAALYEYFLKIIVVIAITMMIWGGIKYITAGGSSERVNAAKKNITNAITGLLFSLGTYLILYTLNPALVQFKALQILPIQQIKLDMNAYMSGNSSAPGTLADVGIVPKATVGPCTLTIPKTCPGRVPGYVGDTTLDFIGRKKSYYTISCHGRALTVDIIDKYLAEQRRTQVPAGALIAQMVTEAGNCSVMSLFAGGKSDIYYNYGGIGCTQKQVPADGCAHLAFPADAFDVKTKKPFPGLTCKDFNSSKELGQTCVDLCQSSTRDTFTNCGENCYPQKSHASIIKDGTEVWIPSVQCSRKFKSPQDFLDTHLGFVQACMPYNDSVYKFAYCIGASSYAGVTGSKAIMLAEIIDRNCLCDPNTDSTKCVRNKQLEMDLVNGIIKKRNLFLDRTGGKIDYQKVVQGLAESTRGLLKPTDRTALVDTEIPPEDTVEAP